ncbi:nucleoside 2-deoxyribosyltransferase [Amphritea sp. 1_MG-2023]|uniref:nucleoside 2-deoxyribosyltransferase n=1 Tax=Amphritea sp. 1_MG-2023 TaxID=3062670 RepID=UPI0026E255B5|nr:nucleoside 2-deoxyribosyltransferase [Amphritea sp. 1_MG-2023]MDO6562730.1 nucleoside 2-deoxyribosyltransferase [Amphritea sp. 1_MG-2023]
MSTPSIYLAGPDVFWPNAIELGAAKKKLCQRYGFTGLFPLDNSLDLSSLSPYQAGLAIYRANIELMNRCDLIIANMTPFRGPSMDVGTAFEMGYLTALNKPVWGYSLDGRLYSDRIDGSLTDAEGFSIERFDMADNLMMIGALEQQGGLITKAHSETLTNHLTLFEQVLKQL